MARKKLSQQKRYQAKQAKKQAKLIAQEKKITQPVAAKIYSGTIGKTSFKRPVGMFKKADDYIDKVWEVNRQEIQQKGLNERQFKLRIKSIMEEEGISARKAVIAYGRTRTFLSAEQIGMQNIQTSMDKVTSQEIKRALNLGNKKIDYSEFSWNKNEQRWEHKDGIIALKYTYPDDSKTESIVSVITI